MGRKSVAGSVIGGIAETQELLDFCGRHGITSDIEVIKIQFINEAYERMLKKRREAPLRDRSGNLGSFIEEENEHDEKSASIFCKPEKGRKFRPALRSVRAWSC